MITPSERLEKIIAAKVPSKVVFKVSSKSDRHVSLGAVKIQDAVSNVISEDAELQTALATAMEEYFDRDEGRYYLQSNVNQLWGVIQRTILREYEKVSDRCAATRRKTEKFIRDIKVTDKHLPNYLIQVFLRVRSNTYDSTSYTEQKDLFEQFESLRRTYGKRS